MLIATHITTQDVQTLIEGIALIGGAMWLSFGPFKSKAINQALKETNDAYSDRLNLLEAENKECEKNNAVLNTKYESLKEKYDWLSDLVKINTTALLNPEVKDSTRGGI